RNCARFSCRACSYLNALIPRSLPLYFRKRSNEDDAQQLTRQLREGVVAAATTPELSGTIEIDEVYLVAGHKGQHAEVQKSGQAWSTALL
ncbi:hypothetical protein, partial [Deinococcus sp. UYEF24]